MAAISAAVNARLPGLILSPLDSAQGDPELVAGLLVISKI